MKHILYKVSSHGWVKVFNSEYDAKMELLNYICNNCIEGMKKLEINL